jgi:cytochrome c-type biogenesis protein CcmH/NrfG
MVIWRRTRDAVTELTSLLGYYPVDVAANLQLGGIEFQSGQSDPRFFQQAKVRAVKVLSKQPQTVEALMLSGNAAAAMQDYRDAIEKLGQAVFFSVQKAGAARH